MGDLIFKQALDVLRMSYPDKYCYIIGIIKIYLYENSSYFGIDEEMNAITELCESEEFMRCLAIVAFHEAARSKNIKELIRG